MANFSATPSAAFFWEQNVLAQQNGRVASIYGKQYTQFNIWRTKAALQLKVHYPAADILNISGVFASLEEKGGQTAITVNNEFFFLCVTWLDFICRRQKLNH